MITKAIKNAFRIAKERNWDRTFWAFDIHATMIKPNYDAGNVPTEFYPHAIETLQLISNRKDVDMILWTCSHPHEIDQYIKIFEAEGITFKFVNENPDVPTQGGGYGCYDRKFYMNVVFEDKAGFDADEDWEKVLDLVKNTPEYLGN